MLCLPVYTILLLFYLTTSANAHRNPVQAFLGHPNILIDPNTDLLQSRVTRNIKKFTIINEIPRNGRQFFTEGLAFRDANTLLESSGLYGKSLIQYVDSHSMKVLESRPLDKSMFGEGCDLVMNGNEGTIYQLTYRERKVNLWDADTLRLKGSMKIPGEIVEGWGIAKRVDSGVNGKNLVELFVSDGTSNIYVVDPENFKIKRSIEVTTSQGLSVSRLNELEFVKGKLWANIFGSHEVAVIDPNTGFVEALIDFTPLSDKAFKTMTLAGQPWEMDNVLNGIAYHEETNRLLMTGKMWPYMWEIEVEDL